MIYAKVLTPALLTGVLTACLPARVEQSPEQQVLADRLYEFIMDRAGPYPAMTGRKVMYACIAWGPPEAPPRVLDLNYYYTEPNYHYSLSVMVEMRQGASSDCDTRRHEARLDCTCQQIDENDQNVIAVPDRTIKASQS